MAKVYAKVTFDVIIDVDDMEMDDAMCALNVESLNDDVEVYNSEIVEYNIEGTK